MLHIEQDYMTAVRNEGEIRQDHFSCVQSLVQQKLDSRVGNYKLCWTPPPIVVVRNKSAALEVVAAWYDFVPIPDEFKRLTGYHHEDVDVLIADIEWKGVPKRGVFALIAVNTCAVPGRSVLCASACMCAFAAYTYMYILYTRATKVLIYATDWNVPKCCLRVREKEDFSFTRSQIISRSSEDFSQGQTELLYNSSIQNLGDAMVPVNATVSADATHDPKFLDDRIVFVRISSISHSQGFNV